MRDATNWQLATQAVHAGKPKVESGFIPTVGAIHPSVSYRYPTMDALDAVFEGTRSGYVYGRYGNPTVTALEEAIAEMEAGERGLAFGSGMAAIHTSLLATGAEAGSTIVAAQDIYGATYALLNDLLTAQGVAVRFVDATDLDAVRAACAELKPAALIAETISNPLLKVADIPALSEVAHTHGATLLVDSTFTTPYLMQPLSLGADLVIHSATKYLAGHGDVLGGVVVTSEARRQALFEVLKVTGGNLGPHQAWLTLRGMRTLPLRMRQHCQNALAVARWLDEHPQVSRVLYPGLPSHPQHALATDLFGRHGYGGMVAFEIAGAGQREIFHFFEALNLCIPATTLGDVHSLTLYPAHSSHRALSTEERARIGIGDGLVRMSVGIEAVDDLIDDLDQALDALG